MCRLWYAVRQRRYCSMFLCVVYAKEPMFPGFLCAQVRRTQCVPPWSYYLTSDMFILYLEWEECCLTVWDGSCFTLHWVASSTCILASWMLFFGCMCAVWMGGGCWGLGEWLWPWEAQRPSKNRSLISWPIKYSNTGPSWEPWDLLENATDSLKSSGEITTLFTSPPETCAKSSSCTSLCTGPLKARAELVSVYIVRMKEALTDTLKMSDPAGIYDLG